MSSKAWQATDRVYRAIRQRIRDGVYRSGEFLSEVVLAGEFGVSRTPVREALARLLHEGLVHRGYQRGYSVAPLSVRELRDLFTVRRNLESALIEDTIERATPELLDGLGSLAATEIEHDASADGRFHLALANAGGNVLALEVIERCVWHTERVLLAGATRDLHLPPANHAAIVDAIGNRNRERARALLGEDLDQTFAFILERCIGIAPAARG